MKYRIPNITLIILISFIILKFNRGNKNITSSRKNLFYESHNEKISSKNIAPLW